jgi:uncharacterized protein (TIGR00251 family)
MRDFNLHDGRQGVAVAIRVTPRARKTEIVGIEQNGTIRIRVAESIKEGHINKALKIFMAKVLGVRQNRVDIVAGEEGLDKLISVLEMSTDEVEKRIRASIVNSYKE